VAQLFSLGGLTFMKHTFTILLLGAIFCGCSKKQATNAVPAADLIIAGKDIPWHGGEVLHVTKRDGDLIEGLRIVTRTGATITADKGTIKRGLPGIIMPDQVLRNTNMVTLVLEVAHMHAATTDETIRGLNFTLSP
jgi:hypothetical protein